MLIKEIFETQMQDKGDSIVSLDEWQDEQKLTAELERYVVTPQTAAYIAELLKRYCESLSMPTPEIGVCIQGDAGSGKTYLAKLCAILCKYHTLDGNPISRVVEEILPQGNEHSEEILASLNHPDLKSAQTKIMSLNLSTLADSKTTPLFRFLLAQYYLSKGYSNNLFYASVIEAELDKRGKLDELHAAAERMTDQPWTEIQKKLGFYAKNLYNAAHDVAPEVFATPEDVAKAIKNMMSQALKITSEGGLFNVKFLIKTILDDLDASQVKDSIPCQLLLVLDDVDKWLEDDAGRLAQLKGFIEEAATGGEGRIWVLLTTTTVLGTEKLGNYFPLTITMNMSNISSILSNSVFKKTGEAQLQLKSHYQSQLDTIKAIAELKNTLPTFATFNEEQFVMHYPLLPYQVEFVSRTLAELREGGCEQKRTLVDVINDVLANSKRNYMNQDIGVLVPFDDIYDVLATDGTVSPEVQRDINRIGAVVADSDLFTRRVGEVLYLAQQVNFIPRTLENIARMLAESTSDDVSALMARVRPELERLQKARLINIVGEEYEFLTGERRLFAERLCEETEKVRAKDIEELLADLININTLGFQGVQFRGQEFALKIYFDNRALTQRGTVSLRMFSPLLPAKLEDLVTRSTKQDEQLTLFVLCNQDPALEQLLRNHVVLHKVSERLKHDSSYSPEARDQAIDSAAKELKKTGQEILSTIMHGLNHFHMIFRGNDIAVTPANEKADNVDLLKDQIVKQLEIIYPESQEIPTQIKGDQRAVMDVLQGVQDLLPEVQQLRIFNEHNKIDLRSLILSALCEAIFSRQNKREKMYGRDLVQQFRKPPYGWDESLVRVGIAALVKAGVAQLTINRKLYSSPTDKEIQDALRGSYSFESVELVLSLLADVQELLIRYSGNKRIAQTSEAVSEAFEKFGKGLIAQASRAVFWAEAADLPLPHQFEDGKQSVQNILKEKNPGNRVAFIHANIDNINQYMNLLPQVSHFADANSRVYTDMHDFAKSVVTVEHRLTPGGPAQQFITAWKNAYEQAEIINETVWKNLQKSLKDARGELNDSVTAWRKEAEKMVKDGLNKLPKLLQQSDLPLKEMQETLGNPLREFLDSTYFVTEPIKVAALLDTAQSLIKKMEEAIRAEVDKREEKKRAEEEARRKAEEAKRRATEQAKQRTAEDKARQLAEVQAKQKAETAAKQKAQEAAQKRAEETARKRAEEEAHKRAAEEAKRRASEEARKRAEEETARRRAEVMLRKKAEEDARKRAEEEARKRAEQEARRRAEETARKRVEEEMARKQAEEEEEQKKKRAAELLAQQQAEERERTKKLEQEQERKHAEQQASQKRAAEETRLQQEQSAAAQKAETSRDKVLYVGPILTMIPVQGAAQWELVRNFIDTAIKQELTNGSGVRLEWSEEGNGTTPDVDPAKVKVIHVGAIVAMIPIQSAGNWDLIRNFLDTAVKQELANGMEVKLVW